ncbi:MAG TPA: prepilin-type N-terminal cleavage/methylation domain-containing protein, partial [Candidatus Ozemobacteraceae bacterium]|nr:prepilin-type N-terminal cleavage/methylation domain-containing protein [Candidatus Ozemobacteraceae bacterium]
MKRMNRRAFTLPEVLITILLISILFSLGIVFSMGMRHTRKARDYETAIGLAQQAVDALRSVPFNTLD